MRGKPTVYLTVGHGELTHPESLPTDRKSMERRSTELRRVLGVLSYEIKDLSRAELAREIPGDATIVIVAGPVISLLPGEWASLERYLDRGGRLLIMMDPLGASSMGSLEGRLGLRMLPGHLVDDKASLPMRKTVSDRAFVLTAQFSVHASTTALARAVGQGVVLIDAGALEQRPFTSKGEAPKQTITIRSEASSWLDLEQPQNFTFDAAAEKRQRWNIGAAVEGPRIHGKDGFRALVFSDVDLFADAVVPNPAGQPRTVMPSGPLLLDAIRWLGGEEVGAGSPARP